MSVIGKAILVFVGMLCIVAGLSYGAAGGCPSLLMLLVVYVIYKKLVREGDIV